MTLVSTLAAFAMAFGAPLVYADQAWSIQKKRNSDGFSKDICAVLLIANICRLFFWLGNRFEFALLLQSVLMIAAQLFLLSLLIKFRPGSYASSAFSVGSGDRDAAATATPPASAKAQPSTGASSYPEFSADDAFDGQSGSGSRTSSSQPRTTSSSNDPASAGGLFNKAPTDGRYAPLFGLHLPPAPTLADDGDDEEDAPNTGSSVGQRVQRLGRKTVRFVQSGLKRDEGGLRRDGSSGGRPFGFWTWPDYSSYLLFLVVLIVFLGILQVIFGSFSTYIWLLGMFALGLEATLPIPQAIQNQQRKSLSGFRITVLLGWLGGDIYKSLYFLINGSPAQFIISALFALTVDCVICAQLYFFREQTALDDDDARASQAEALEAGQRQRAPPPIEDGGSATPAFSAKRTSKSAPRPSRAELADDSSRFQIEADDEDDEDGDIGGTRK